MKQVAIAGTQGVPAKYGGSVKGMGLEWKAVLQSERRTVRAGTLRAGCEWMYPVNRWLAVDAQVGVTGFCSMATDREVVLMIPACEGRYHFFYPIKDTMNKGFS